MSTLVTGATGFIGRSLVDSLASRGEEMRLLCRPSADTTGLEAAGAIICRGDIGDRPSIRAAIAGCDRVYHLAACARGWARDENEYIRNNIEGVRNILEAALVHGVRRVVAVSSSVSYGPSDGVPLDEEADRERGPYTLYERTKILGDACADRAFRRGLDVVVVHPTRVFGPGRLTEANSTTRMLQLTLSGSWRWLPASGAAIGNYVFVGDVVNGLLLAMDRGRAGEHYILGGANVSYRELFDRIGRLANRRIRLLRVPRSLAMAVAGAELLRARISRHHPLITPGWVRTFLDDWSYSSQKAARELGYRPTPLDQALSLTIDWLSNAAPEAGGAR